MEAVRLVLLLALHYGLFCRHVDFVTDFLNGPIDVEIYMSQPEFFDDGTGRITSKPVWFKAAPENMASNIEQVFKQCGFERSKMDGGVYFRWVNGSPIFLILYVDDIVIAATMENIKLVLTELGRAFKIKDLGDSFARDGDNVCSRYIDFDLSTWILGQLLERFKMASCKAVSTPQAKGNFPCPGDPDRETYAPWASSLSVTQRITLCSLSVPYATYRIGYADADLGNEKDDRRSITGYVLQLIGCTFAYKSKKQPIMTDDTAVLSLWLPVSECSNMIMWAHSLRAELKLRRTRQTIIYEDNQAAIKVVGEASSNKIRDFVGRKVFRVKYCATDENIADIFTKPLEP
ncbi:LOW QUALITY PROTEIN: Polyprotein [Phytophthora palmivora]|uniref:Polyprotein n=1 Tax=Phytophthora palmivora TaxID=4796 RepID=A0A2P4Y942_9STRA|nr:LOW QUALITY PROTEIN: Polyprotein [Phytophthora palmivora]